MTTLTGSLTRAAGDAVRGVETWFVSAKHAPYGLSLSRILVGSAILGILVSNFGVRHVQWGPASGWIEAYRVDASFGSLHEVFGTSSTTLFTLQYLLLMAVAVAVILGWRTRLTTALLVVGITALVERNGLVGDQGDNIARIGLLLMVFMDASAHWSLDARRRRRRSGGAGRGIGYRLLHGLPLVPRWLSNPVHNAALMALALQLFILYTASALFKVQGEFWQDGTALYYPLSLHEYRVFPWVNELLTHNELLVTGATYFAVFIQLFFAVGLLHPVTRRVALVGVLLMHLGIAVLMGLPWFSLSMLAFDSIFVSTATFVTIEAVVAGRVRHRRRRATSDETTEPGAPTVAPAPARAQ